MVIEKLKLTLKAALVAIVLLAAHAANSQIYIEKGPVGALKGAEIMIYGPDLSQMSIPYARIKGSPFWRDEWQVATLYSDDKLIGTVPVKINLVTNDVHFLHNDQELVATDENKITAIIFHPGGDSSLVTAAFMKDLSQYAVDNRNLKVVMQVLNYGKYELLKYVDRKVSSADSLFGTQKRYFFKDEVTYYLKADNIVQSVKKLSEASFYELIPALTTASHRRWLNENKINFHKEQDIIRFLNYYNSQIRR